MYIEWKTYTKCDAWSFRCKCLFEWCLVWYILYTSMGYKSMALALCWQSASAAWDRKARTPLRDIEMWPKYVTHCIFVVVQLENLLSIKLITNTRFSQLWVPISSLAWNVITISSYQSVTYHASNNAKGACFEYPLWYALCDPKYDVSIATVYRRTCSNWIHYISLLHDCSTIHMWA